MEDCNEQDLANDIGGVNLTPETNDTGVSRAELQRAHTRVAARLGDLVANGRDTVATEIEPEDSA